MGHWDSRISQNNPYSVHLLPCSRFKFDSLLSCKQTLNFRKENNKWQNPPLGPTQELEITLHIDNILKNKIKDGHNSTKIGASNISGGNQLRF